MTDLTSPRDLAGLIRDRWGVARGDGESAPAEPTDTAAGLAASWLGNEAPPRAVLEDLLSICYQASLLSEEQRPVSFRLILAEPTRFPPGQGPPDGLHCLTLAQGRPFNPLELRRLSPAADFYRSLLGVSWNEHEGLRIWGILHSGTRWLQNFYGGRGRPQALPPALVLSVTAPGRLTVGFGSRVVARLEGGQLTRPSANVFESRWMARAFDAVRAETWALHQEERTRAAGPWAPLDPGVGRILAQQLIRRMISALRTAQHGATILILPETMTAECCGANGYINLKYRFEGGEPRLRFRTLILRIMRRLSEIGGAATDPARTVGWLDYTLVNDEKLGALDEAMIEMSRLIAGCAEVDGAVVLTKRFELLGFGGEIAGMLPDVPVVRQARDLEGLDAEEESTESVGTRHRSTYRLCRAIPETVAIVVSQDGGVRFVKSLDGGAVTYWDQSSTTSLDV